MPSGPSSSSLSAPEDTHLAHCDLEWCFYQQAIFEGVDQKRREGKHNLPLPRDASECLLPLFEHLTDSDLL